MPPTVLQWPAGAQGPTGPTGGVEGDQVGKRSHGRNRVRLKSHTESLWRGGQLILKGRVYGVFSSSKKTRAVVIQIRRHGRWSTAGRPRVDNRGRFATRPHLRRAQRSGHGHSTLMIGRGYIPFKASAVWIRANVAGTGHSHAVRVRLRR